MFGLGITELLLIFVIALIVFGPKKLPELGKSIGRAMAEFKKASEEFQESVRAEMKEVEKSADVKETIKQIERDVAQIGAPASDRKEEPLGYSEVPPEAPKQEGEENKEHGKGSA